MSLSILDRHGNELSSRTDIDHPFEFFIPRDANLPKPIMSVQHVTASKNASESHQTLFNLHYVNITRSDQLSVSVHLQVDSLNSGVAYLIVHRFDAAPLLNSTTRVIDGWRVMCPESECFSLGRPQIRHELRRSDDECECLHLFH